MSMGLYGIDRRNYHNVRLSDYGFHQASHVDGKPIRSLRLSTGQNDSNFKLEMARCYING